MVSIRELYRTGYTFQEIQHAPAEKNGSSKLKLRRISPLDLPKMLDRTDPSLGPWRIVSDLQEYIADRVYGVFPGSGDSYYKHDGSEVHTLNGDLKDGSPEVAWAVVTTKNQGREVEITLPTESDRLYPEVDIEARIQRQQLLEDYSQIFKETKRALSSGRYD